MAILFKNFKTKFFQIIPLILLFIISLNGASVLDFKYVSVNVHYILIYYWVLRMPQALGYGFIFLSGSGFAIICFCFEFVSVFAFSFTCQH